MNKAIDSFNKNFTFMSEIQNSISKITPNIAPILSNTDVLFRNQEIMDSVTRFMRIIPDAIEFKLPPQTMDAITEAVHVMDQYITWQGLGRIEIRATEEPEEGKKNFFQKVEATASKYQVSWSLLLAIIGIIISLLPGPVSSEDMEELKELQRKEIEYTEIQIEQNEEIIQLLSEIRDANSNSQDELKELLDDLQDSINAVLDAADQTADAAKQICDSTDFIPQEEQTDEDKQHTEVQNNATEFDELQ